MPLTVGTQLGSHEITGLLGKGGMGEVYRARDLKLKREVAIKILPEEFSRDADRVSRFQREAEVLASLNHPNIAGIYDVQEAQGSRFLVLELVEGETLAERLKRGPLPIAEALSLARSICEALEAAHEKGVVHRDLKPANVKITPDGKVKVLDFGLAKALENAPATGDVSNSPTLMSIAGTQAGMILGTAAYMSPEQAKGLHTDERSDVFSFGAVFYEMFTGRQAFQGDNVSEVFASVLAREPDFSLMPSKLSSRIRELLRRSLEKNPKRRWHAIADVRVEIEAALADPRGAIVDESALAVSKPLWKRAIPFVVTAALTASISTSAMWYLRPVAPLTVTRFPIILPEGQQFNGTNRQLLAISSDGTEIAYTASLRLYHRSISEVEARPIPGSDALSAPVNPVFSPDGKSLAVFSSGLIKKIPITGGPALTICPADAPLGMSWSAGGIVFGQYAKGIMRVSANGGQPETLVAARNGEVLFDPEILPDGKAVMFTASSPGTAAPGAFIGLSETSQIVIQTLTSGERKAIIQGGVDAHYLPFGDIVFGSGGNIFSVPFDRGRSQVIGGPTPVVEGVQRNPNGNMQFSISNTGSLVYIPGPSATYGNQLKIAFADRKGSLDPLKLVPGSYEFPRVSPDGNRIAFGTEDGKEAFISIYELSGASSPRRLTVGGGNRYPVWSADGQRVAFQSDREGDLGIFWQRADGTGTAERLTKGEPGTAQFPDSWSRDGQRLSFTVMKGNTASVWIYSLQEKKATLFAEAPESLVSWSAFSPDGHWITYHSNETKTGVFEIWVQPFPATGAKHEVSKDGAILPVWSRDGKELLFLARGGPIASVNVATQPGFTFTAPAYFPRPFANTGVTNLPRNYDITPDGKLIGVIPGDSSQAGAPIGPQIQVVLNWFEDVKQKMSSK
jgi:serine/threonine-protein kinase